MVKQVILESPGVYVLYRGDEPYYVGRSKNLYLRLFHHSNKLSDRSYALWDYFSAFVLQDKRRNAERRLIELEAILISAIPRAANSSKPRFRKLKIPKSLVIDD